jgi:subtilisin family serine protease
MLALAAQSLAQDPAPVPTGIVQGSAPGTERWIAHFSTRSFDLTPFRDAVHARAAVASVNAIVADMEASMRRDQAGFVADVERLGGRVVHQYWIVNAASFEIAPARLDAVRALPNVARLEPDMWVEPVIITATNAANHNSDAVNAGGDVGLGVATGIMDTGQDENMAGAGRPHETYFINGDPGNNQGGGIGGSRLVINRLIGTTGPDDPNGHGTGVAGIVAGAQWTTAQADNGHAPRAQIAGYCISNSAGGGSTFAVIAAAWQSMAADRAQYNIVSANNSYSGTPDPLNVSQQALDSAAYNADIMVCVAAANSGASTSSSQSCANGLAVAALNATAHTVATFSSRGPLSGDTTRFYPDISGCGVNTIMPRRDAETMDYVASGTSMASPQVCGAATLIRAAVPSMVAVETKAVLLASARDISAQNPNAPYNTRNAYGMGLLRDDDAMVMAKDADRHGTWCLDVQHPIYRRLMNVTAGTLYQVAVAWHRMDVATRNWANIDLLVFNSGGTEIARADSPRNLYEMVRFTPNASGTVEIRVVATAFEQGATSQVFGWATSADSTSAQPAAFDLYGTACGGVTLSNLGRPELDRAFFINLSGAPASTNRAALFAGFSDTMWGSATLPVELSFFQAPGCFLLAPGEVQLGAVVSGGNAQVRLGVPKDYGLVGMRIYFQWLVPSPANGLGLVFTRGGRATLGLP